MRLNDWSNTEKPRQLHSHSTDAAQEGFYKACKTAKALKKTDPSVRYPHWPKKFRTTIWKSQAIKYRACVLELSNGLRNPKITICIPESLRCVLRFLEVRLVYDKRACRYDWHLVVEDGKQVKTAPGSNVVSVDLGEIHPAVVGDDKESTVITCRDRRQQSQGHAKRLSSIAASLSRKKKGSRRHKRLVRCKTQMKAKYALVMRDLEHKIARAVVDVAVELKASTIAIGDVRDIANNGGCGRVHNGRMSRWNHGKVRTYIEYKAEEEGMSVELVNERFTSQTCPSCGGLHKPKGRIYHCPFCGFSGHRDVVGQMNILSIQKCGKPGMIPVIAVPKYRIPQNLRVMRRRRGTGQAVMPVARSFVPLREAAGF